jgi:hypothetical protein
MLVEKIEVSISHTKLRFPASPDSAPKDWTVPK